MVVNKWLNRTTEVVEAVLRHYTEHVNTPANKPALTCHQALGLL